MDQKFDFDTYGWEFIKKQNQEPYYKELIIFLNRLNENKIKINEWEEISGGYLQSELKNQGKLKENIAKYAKLKLKAKGINTQHLQTCHFKILKASPGSEQQFPHMDGFDPDSFVVATYVSFNKSTDVSTYPCIKKDYREMNDEESIALGSERWKDFVRFDTEPGDIMIFKECVLHRGIKNESNEDRYVLFLMLIPEGKYHTDKNQHFEFNWIAECYGYDSLMYKEYMEKNPDAVKHI